MKYQVSYSCIPVSSIHGERKLYPPVQYVVFCCRSGHSWRVSTSDGEIVERVPLKFLHWLRASRHETLLGISLTTAEHVPVKTNGIYNLFVNN